MPMKDNVRKSHTRGFTIIEMLIAVFIFTVSIAALTIMAGRGIRSTADSQHRMTAEFLAVEAVEAVRNVRDNAFLSGNASDWSSVFNNISGSGCLNEIGDSNQNKACGFSYVNGVPLLEDCPTSNCKLFLHPSQMIYQYNSGDDTLFSRYIYINEVSAGEAQVRVRVEWEGDAIEYEDHLFLWN